MNFFMYVVILGIVEGITEFLPISSTGHMIIVGKLLNTEGLLENFMNAFMIIIQLGSILSVVAYFFKDLNPFVRDKIVFKEKMTLWSKIIVGVIPAVILGVLFDDKIEELFFNNTNIIAIMLIVYGIFYLFSPKLEAKSTRVQSIRNVSYKDAFTVGLFQCLAMIPGTSRSGSTILGGLLIGLEKSVIAEFTFFLAIPTMFGATLLKLLKMGFSFTGIEWIMIFSGSVLAFFVSLFVIKWLMGYIKKKSFRIFGVYRIILGIIVLIFFNVFK